MRLAGGWQVFWPLLQSNSQEENGAELLQQIDRLICGPFLRASQEVGGGDHSQKTKFFLVVLYISEGKLLFQGAYKLIALTVKIPARALLVHYAHFLLS